MKPHAAHTSTLLAALLLAIAPPVAAQEDGAPLKEKIDKAIKDYEAVRTDKTKLAQRRRLVGWLGEIDHPRVTKYLQKELRSYARFGSGVYVIEAMGKVERPEVQADLMKAVKRPDAYVSVRTAATQALVAFGDEATDELFELAVETKNESIKRGVIVSLCGCDSARVRRELAKLITDGEHAHRRYMLLHTATVSSDEAVDRARVQCVKEGNLLVAATAWRILAEQGSARALTLTLDVIERVYDQPDAASAVELVRGLAAVGDADFFPALLRYGAVRGRAVKQALKTAAKSVAKQPELIQFLIEEGLESELTPERTAAKILLGEAPAESLQPLVEKMRKQLRRNRKKVLDTAAGLHELLVKDASWVQDLASLAAAPDLESRMLGLALLLEMKSPAAITSAQKCLRHRAWELRSLAFRYLAVNRDVTSIPLLISRYGAEEGRLKHELETALFLHTGKRCWTRSNWNKWWRKSKEGFALPHPDTVKGGGTTTGGQTVSYYDMPLVSSRIAFVVDHSGSMAAKVGTDKKRTRLDVAKAQLTNVVESLPKTHKVNVIFFESAITSVWKEVRALSAGNRRELLDDIQAVKQTGGTNLYDAVEFAFQDPEVDTVYLLTDGQPGAGKYIEAEDIVEQVRLMNRTRQIVIHCISIGRRSTLLSDIAKQSGGTYKEVR
ncbi:MAG: VWA domain-containing protein [Planctomycetota bacterium]|nr:VWA domain-containing protein [Planctomycetota bacterium]